MNKNKKYECSVCGKLMDSFSSLGGHKSSHNRKTKDQYIKSLRDISCLNCGSVSKEPEWSKRIYCSVNCRVAHHKKNSLRTIFNFPSNVVSAYIEKNTKCEICGNEEKSNTSNTRKDRINRLCKDHNHQTNNFRGALCYSCNVKLGWYEKLSSEINAYLILNNDVDYVKRKMGI